MGGFPKKLAFFLILLVTRSILHAQSFEPSSPVTASLICNQSALVPGGKMLVGVLLKMTPGWHTYYRDPGDSGMATTIQWQLPAGFVAGELHWPKPIQETEPGDFKVNIYTDEVLLWTEITIPAALPDPTGHIGAQVKWLACKESCIPGESTLALLVPISNSSQPVNQELFDKYLARDVAGGSQAGGAKKEPAKLNPAPIEPEGNGFWHYLWFAFIGGLILNVMPCVLPVISLKLLGLLNHGNESPARIRALGFIYALGVFVSFLLLAGLVIAAQRAGNLAGWGFQFQSPVFVVALTILVTLVSLNLFGLFEITLGSSTLTTVSSISSKEGAMGSFFNGVFAVVLATPCTAPFLGAALGFAFLQSPGVIVLFFTAVACGLAFPYVVICSFPKCIGLLPRPGAWMERFKIAMGFPMLATAVWLYSVASRHYGVKSLWLGLFIVILAFAMWVYGEFYQRGRAKRGLALAVTILLVLGGYGFALEDQLHWRNPEPVVTGASLKEDPSGIDWKPWSPEAVEAARRQGHPVLVDFTADWCLTCQTNKITSLEIPSVRERLKQGGFEAFVGDYTRKNDAITQELKKFRRAGVPLVVVYPVQGEPQVLPELLRPGLVLEALSKATAPGL